MIEQRPRSTLEYSPSPYTSGTLVFGAAGHAVAGTGCVRLRAQADATMATAVQAPAFGGDARALKDVIAAKERELSELGDYRVASLEAAVKERDEKLRRLQATVARLRDDFGYNLKLVEERDVELAAAEEAVRCLEERVRDSEGRKRELVKDVEDRNNKLERAARALAEREAAWRERLDEQKEELDRARWLAQDGARKAREVDAKLRLEYASKLKDAAEDAARSRGDLERAFEESSNKRDADRRVADEALLEAQQHAETKLQEAKHVARKAEDLRAEAERATEASSRRCAELEQQLQRERWERDDDNRRASQRERELEERLGASKSAFERCATEASTRRGELEARLDGAAEALRHEAERRATDLADAREAAQQTLEKTVAEHQALRDVCLREALRAERQQTEAVRERALGAAAEAVEAARTEARAAGARALDELRAVTRRDVSLLAERAEDIEGSLEAATRERARLAAETAELRRALDAERAEAAARYGDLERRRTREVDAARAELPEGYRDASVESDLRAQVERLRADSMRRGPEAERLEAAFVVAKSDLAEVRAELARERKRTVVARASPLWPPPCRASAVDDAIHTAGPASPLFSDDNGAVSPLRLDIPASLDSEVRPSAVEARQREVIAAMRRDLDLLREHAAGDKKDRQREVHALRDREAATDASRAEAARLVAKRVECLERDVAQRDAELKAARAQLRDAPVNMRDDRDRVQQLARAIRELTRKNEALRTQRDQARAELAVLQQGAEPVSASKELRSLKAQLAARDKRATPPPPPPGRYLTPPPPGAASKVKGARARRARAPAAPPPRNYNDLRAAEEASSS